MANHSIAPSGFSDNDIMDLSVIFSHELQACFKKPLIDDCWKWFDTVAGLGYTAIFTDSNGIWHDIYQKCFDAFMCARKAFLGGELRSSRSIRILSYNLAELVGGAFSSFCKLKFPCYFHGFLEALERILSSAQEEYEERVNRLMAVIEKNCPKVEQTESNKNKKKK